MVFRKEVVNYVYHVNIGSATITEINEVKDQKLLLHEIAMRRKKNYESLFEKDFTQEVF